MKTGKIVSCGLILSLLLAGCGRISSAKPDLSSLGKINAISREDGSGTRAEFENLLNTNENGSISDTASSTEDLIGRVAADPSAIGYAALDSVTSDADVKIVSVDGTAPSAETIKNAEYPLTRKYYLAWLGDQSDLEREFLTYARSAGQKYVAEAAVPVARETSFLSLRPSGRLKITGSSSMAPLVEKLAGEYMAVNPAADIKVEQSDSSEGLIDVMQGKSDLAMSSRELKDYEKNVLSCKDIAADGIAVIVNSGNPLSDISSDDLKKIYDGDAENWADL